MSLFIIKKGNKNFTHTDSEYSGSYGANDITIIFDGENVKLRSFSGRVVFNKQGYDVSDVIVRDDSVGGSNQVYPTVTDLAQALIDLGYLGYFEDGEITGINGGTPWV